MHEIISPGTYTSNKQQVTSTRKCECQFGMGAQTPPDDSPNIFLTPVFWYGTSNRLLVAPPDLPNFQRITKSNSFHIRFSRPDNEFYCCAALKDWLRGGTAKAGCGFLQLRHFGVCNPSLACKSGDPPET